MKVRIEMETRQRVDGTEEVFRHTASGILRETGRELRIAYVLDGVRQSLRVDPERRRVVVLRGRGAETAEALPGDVPAHAICYEAGRHHVTMYETPVGEMELGFRTSAVSVQQETAGDLSIQLSYEMTQYGVTAADCELRIQIKPLAISCSR